MKHSKLAGKQKLALNNENRAPNKTFTYNVLLDFKPAQAIKNCGIGRDTYTIFSALQSIDSIRHIGLLIYPWHLRNQDFQASTNDHVLAQASSLYSALDLDTHVVKPKLFPKAINEFLKRIKLCMKFAKLLVRPCTMAPINKSIFRSVIYRNLLPEPKYRQALKKVDVWVGNFSKAKMSILAALQWLPCISNKMPPLDTVGHDFFITQWWNIFTIPSNTTLIIRWHDLIPITDFDMMPEKADCFLNLLNLNSKKAYFVCDSEPSEIKLLELLPQLTNKTFVVPCAVSDSYKHKADLSQLKAVLIAHWATTSIQHLSLDNISAFRKKNAIQVKKTKSLDYILFVSTIDARKNLQSLIEAWHALYINHGLRLVICGNKGWNSQDTLKQISHFVETGAIIHLENVPARDIPLLYSHARALISPSYSEGFGLPVVEAMRCQCPAIISDIEEYRWVAGDAALYFDPGDVNELRIQIHRLLFEKNSEELRKKLINAGLIQSERYTVQSVSQAWQTTLNKIFDEKAEA